MTYRIPLTVFVLAMLGIAGCADSNQEPPALEDSPDNVRVWANAASAVGAYAHVYAPLAIADGELELGDPSCPIVTDDGTVLTVTGGCTDRDGSRYEGSVTLTRDSSFLRTLRFEGYGSDRYRRTGTAIITETGAEQRRYEIDLVIESESTEEETRGEVISETVRYRGHVVGTYDGSSRWNGTGTVERRGMLGAGSAPGPQGVIEATTTDQVIDDSVCHGESLSGTTTLRSGEDTVVTYDGATRCTEDSTARWSFNGEERGIIDGITCAARPGAGSHVVLAAVMLGMALLLRHRAR